MNRANPQFFSLDYVWWGRAGVKTEVQFLISYHYDTIAVQICIISAVEAYEFYKKSRSYLKIPGARRITHKVPHGELWVHRTKFSRLGQLASGIYETRGK